MIENKTLIELYRANVLKLYKFFYYKTGDKTIAEDLTSETFTSFVASCKGETEIENYNAFLFGIAKNIFTTYLRTKYKRTNNEISIDIEQEFGEYIEEYSEETEKSLTSEERLLKYLDQIPPKQAQIIRMRFIEKMSLQEICEKTGKDMNYVKTTQKEDLNL